MTLCIQSLMKKLFLEEVSKMNIVFQESNIRKERRQKRKKKHVAKRKGKVDYRTGKRGKAK